MALESVKTRLLRLERTTPGGRVFIWSPKMSNSECDRMTAAYTEARRTRTPGEQWVIVRLARPWRYQSPAA
jgi:hypothetical protein